MPTAGFPQDALTHIVNVHWASGGGVFIAINSNGNVYYLELDDQNDQTAVWEDLGTLGFVGPDPDHFIPFPTGCSYGMTSIKDAAGNVIEKKPVFVIVGGNGNATSPGIIMASKNGRDWSRVFTFETTSDTYLGASVWAVAWDEVAQMFFAAGHQTDHFLDHDAEYNWQAETDLLFSSSDGFSWSEAGRHQVKIEGPTFEPLPPWPDDTAGLLNSHCSPRVLDFNGYNVPDGNYGYDKDKDLLIQPNDKMSLNYLFGGIGYSLGTGIIVTGSGEGALPPSSPGLSAVTCVATAGGQWVVAGGIYDPAGGGQPPPGGGKSEAAILVTDEHGVPIWKRLDPPGTNAIIAMCGGLLSDLNPAA
jgi:hypothetical protein